MQMTIDFHNIVNNIITKTFAKDTNKKEVIEYMKQQIERGEYIQPTEVCDILGVQRRHNRAIIRDLISTLQPEEK